MMAQPSHRYHKDVPNITYTIMIHDGTDITHTDTIMMAQPSHRYHKDVSNIMYTIMVA